MKKMLVALLLVPFLLIGCATNQTPEQQAAYQQLAVTTGVSYAVMAYIEQADNPKATAQNVVNHINLVLNPLSVLYQINYEDLTPKDRLLYDTIIQVITIESSDTVGQVSPEVVAYLERIKLVLKAYTV